MKELIQIRAAKTRKSYLELTQKQLISIILKINEMNPAEEKVVQDTIIGPFMETSFGLVFLN